MGPVKPWREKEGGKGNRQGQASIMRFLKDSWNPVPSRLWWTFPRSQSLPLTAWSPTLKEKEVSMVSQNPLFRVLETNGNAGS